MRKRLNVITIFLLILSANVASGDGNKTKLTKANNNINAKGKITERIKRSSNYDVNDKQLILNRGKRQTMNRDSSKNDIDSDVNRKFRSLENKLHGENGEIPFWGNRGRRSSEENYVDSPHTDIMFLNRQLENDRAAQKLSSLQSLKARREDFPFWGNRGRRSSDEVPDDTEITEPFWSSRGRRQGQEVDPFWGARGRRENNLPFWGNRGRREEEPFWGNRGRRDENEPFWGNRGRRQEDDPFWGNRGKKHDDPFWGSRGKKDFDSSEFFLGGARKEDLKDSIIKAINKVEHDIDNLSRLKRGNDKVQKGQFWADRRRDSQLKYLFEKTRMRNRPRFVPLPTFPYELTAKPSQSSTVADDRIYADEPHYIIVERSSRSSAELDPYFISRGKKQSLRGRRGAIEEIVKSVRNDPFYIARGKKEDDNQVANTTIRDDFLKAKELICATVDLMYMKNEDKEVKREISDNDNRDRRNEKILKKLAAQLQNDPYFVSRGKKNGVKPTDIEEFVNEVADMCN